MSEQITKARCFAQAVILGDEKRSVYPVVPEGVPQAWERAQVNLGLCERYQELYQAQVAGLHLLMATMPAPSDPRPAS